GAPPARHGPARARARGDPAVPRRAGTHRHLTEGAAPSVSMDPRAEAVFQRFRVHPGAMAIASPCALEGPIRTIERYQPRRIPEIGAGIGTMTAAILAAAPSGVEIVTVEDDDYCRAELATTLGPALGRVVLVRATDGVVGTFDLVVVDGHQLPEVLHTVA